MKPGRKGGKREKRIKEKNRVNGRVKEDRERERRLTQRKKTVGAKEYRRIETGERQGRLTW